MKKLSASMYPQTISQRAQSSTNRTTWLWNTKVRILVVFWYLYACIQQRALPWNFFQLNSTYFNEQKGIFSKLEIDFHIPEMWRLKQYYYPGKHLPEQFPVFLKPEWGQNSIGIVRVQNSSEYLAFDRHYQDKAMPYIVQNAAPGNREFEVYYLRSPDCNDDCAFLSITQVINSSASPNPINSIHNPDTSYLDITSTFSKEELANIWESAKKIGSFRMARICIKASSPQDLLRESFQIVEINLFLPMPLVLLASNVRVAEKHLLLVKIMMIIARLVKSLPENETGKSIFIKKMKAHYRSKR